MWSILGVLEHFGGVLKHLGDAGGFGGCWSIWGVLEYLGWWSIWG